MLTPATVAAYFPEPEFESVEVRNPRIPARTGRIVWLNLSGAKPKPGYVNTLIGFDDRAIYLCRRGDPDTMPQEWLKWRKNQHALIIACDLTPSAEAAIRRHLPAWVDGDLLRQIMQTQDGITLRDLPPGATGRYTGERGDLAANARDAIWSALVDLYPLNEIQVEPGIELLVNDERRRFTGKSLQIWSDGEITTANCAGPGRYVLTKPAYDLLSIAVRQQEWRRDERWRCFLTVGEYRREELCSDEHQACRSGWSRSLHRVTTDNDLVLYQVTEVAWSMGEDGDVWEYSYLYPEEHLARSRYHSIAQAHEPPQ